ncbi:MAG: nuclear transport factor 2 family protein [Calditrichaeota bacterium]|nr:MAG: nuclear transport factor 2 family protein [Calditrichota bacterium]
MLETDLIRGFYAAFNKKDYKTMAACYHEQAEFSDPVFPVLHGRAIAAMWHMLCASGPDLQVECEGIETTAQQGEAHWRARYSFGPRKRKVHNNIQARFEFRDGRIFRHVDQFDFWRWSRMALGWPGIILGWTPYLQKRVGEQAQKRLQSFMRKHPEYQ